MGKIRRLSIQWHITTRCTNKCRHCYMYDESTYPSESKSEMRLPGLLQILDTITDFQRKWMARIERFYITGGDPLLHPDWLPFLEVLKERGKTIILMGNPETLTGKNVKLLASLGIWGFQMSLDGMEKTHDFFRSPGSFKRTMKAIEKFQRYGIRTNIMFTLFPQNKGDLIPLLRHLAKESTINAFIFDIGTSVGNATSLEGTISAEELRSIFSAYLKEKTRLKEAGFQLTIREKSHMLRLTRFEELSFYPFSSSDFPVISGCLAGWTSVAILSDGTVLPCRRYPVKAGRMPEESFEKVFLSSEILKKFRRSHSFTHCGKCDFYQHCRGCPAVVQGMTGDPFSQNPLCFRHLILRKGRKIPFLPVEAPMETTIEEEHSLITRHFANVLAEKGAVMMKDRAVQKVIQSIEKDERSRRGFYKAPDEYLQKIGISLGDVSKVLAGHILLEREQRGKHDHSVLSKEEASCMMHFSESQSRFASPPPGFHRPI